MLADAPRASKIRGVSPKESRVYLKVRSTMPVEDSGRITQERAGARYLGTV